MGLQGKACCGADELTISWLSSSQVMLGTELVTVRAEAVPCAVSGRLKETAYFACSSWLAVSSIRKTVILTHSAAATGGRLAAPCAVSRTPSGGGENRKALGQRLALGARAGQEAEPLWCARDLRRLLAQRGTGASWHFQPRRAGNKCLPERFMSGFSSVAVPCPQ